MFSDKLDFLMKITNTTNSALGRAVSLDNAHISRLRSGNRALPKKQTFVAPMADFFARNIKEDYQKTAVIEALAYGGSWPSDRRTIGSMLEKWLLLEHTRTDVELEHVISGVSQFDFLSINSDTPTKALSLSGTHYYYGHTGKREAVVAFLEAVCSSGKAQTLYLYSDEPMEWMYEDLTFAKQWAVLLSKVILQGNRIHIIHTVSRNLDEMLEAINKWVPMYMTGAVESYYYPRIRDGISRRTLFIAPDVAAVTSTCVSTNNEDTLNMYLEDPLAVAALLREYREYDSLCVPMMKILRSKDTREMQEKFSALGAVDGYLISEQSGFSLASMSEELALKIMNRTSKSFYKLYKDARLAFDALSNGGSITEIVSLPTVSDINDGRVPISLAVLSGEKNIFYSKEEYKEHLLNIMSLSAQFENYRVVVTDRVPENMLLYYKEGTGIIMAKLSDIPIAFVFSEPHMVAAFGDYLVRRIQNGSSKEADLKQIKDLISEIL